jgi:hypothetical protein
MKLQDRGPERSQFARGTDDLNPIPSSGESVSRMGRAAAVRDLELGGTVECRFGDREIIADKRTPRLRCGDAG